MQNEALLSSGQTEPSSLLERLVAALPELPPIIRYYDDFEDMNRAGNRGGWLV